MLTERLEYHMMVQDTGTSTLDAGHNFNNHFEALWQKACTVLNQKLSPACFQTWLSGLTLLSSHCLSDNALHVTLATDSRFKRDWIAKHYQRLIQETLVANSPYLNVQLTLQVNEADPELTITQHQPEVVSSSTLSPQVLSIPSSESPLTEVHLPERITHPATRSSSAHSSSALSHTSHTGQNVQPVSSQWRPRTRKGLNPKYQMSQLISGDFNQFAKAAALMVAREPGLKYSPLVITGQVGCGKTHLLQAIGHEIHAQHPSLNVRYTTGEQFTNELISTIRQNQWASFRDKFRHVDVLLFDDLHFLAKKERTQQELLHTINTLIDQGKQVVFASNAPAECIDGLSDTLRNRCESGLTVALGTPDYESRRGIIAQKAERDNLPIDEPIADLIAQRFHKNIRALEGAVNKITAYQFLTQSTVTFEKSCEILGQGLNPSVLSAEDIVERVARYYHLDVNTLKGKSRKKNIALARQVAAKLIRELTHASYPVIGQVIGGRSHATILHACKRIDDEAANNPTLSKQLQELRAWLKEPVLSAQ